MIRLAIINSNFVSINRNTKKGTEIFDYILIRQLAKQAKRNNLQITAFASGDSRLPVKIESINYKSSLADKEIGMEHHKTFELALVSKAFSMQNEFDIYHVNIGNGDVVLPLAPFIKKPILVTMHGSFLEEKYNKKYLSLFKNLNNIYFVSISAIQRQPLPNLNYVATIHHGIDVKRAWKFNASGGDHIIWAGRAIREKGISELLRIIKRVKKPSEIFPLIKEESPRFIKRLSEGSCPPVPMVTVNKALSRQKLAVQLQHSRLFLFPVKWEEPFGLVLIEAMASGTPVIAFARGSVPEIVQDGITGYIVNPAPDEIKGEFIIKKTGVDGLCEAVERIYAMPDADYRQMRRQCRERVEKYFTVQQMTKKYIETYNQVIAHWKLQQ